MIRLLMKLFLITIIAPSLENKIEGINALSSNDGSEVAEEDYPFIIIVAGLVRKGEVKEVNRIGGGVLLTDTWALTAAHIFDKLDKKKSQILSVWYGEFSKSPFDSNMFTEVIRIFVHPGFRKMPYVSEDLFFSINDVALMFLSKVNVASYGRLLSVDRASLLGLRAKYIGVAPCNSSGDDENRKLKLGRGMVTRCGAPVRGWSQNLICVIPSCQHKGQQTRYTGSCGDPLLVDDQIIGIFSMNAYTQSSFLWSAFTPVDMYLDWISNVMHDENNYKTKIFQRINENAGLHVL